MPDQTPPLFDSSRKALDFALNQVVAKMPRPFMTKAMAEYQERPKKSRKKKPDNLLILAGTESALDLLEAEEAARRVRRSSGLRPPPLSELDGAATAGFILRHLERLDLRHRTILLGVAIRAYNPCSCGSPCCSGRRPDPRWNEAVRQACYLIQDADDIMVNPAKRGLSTQPELRISLVKQYFTKAFDSQAWMAATFKLSPTTVALHKTLLDAWLARVEGEAWLELDAIFDQVGITGSFEGHD